jgi:hypothetical protein
MNHIIIKELHRSALISKLSELSPSDMKSINETNDTYIDIYKLIIKNDMCYIQNEHVKCYIFKYSNVIYVGIHSTMDYNRKSKLTHFKDKIYIHEGVYNAFVSIEEKLIYNILNLDKNKCVKKIYVTGHGAAGAIATVVSGTLSYKYKNIYIVSCFTFGCPPVGNKRFRKWFIKNINCNYRVNVENDSNISNNLLSCFKYYHISDELRLTMDNIVNITHIDISFIKCMKKIILRRNKVFKSHTPIDIYIEYLKSILLLYKTNICKINQISHSDDKSCDSSAEIQGFSMKQCDSMKSTGLSISSTSSPIMTFMTSPKICQRNSPPNKNLFNKFSPHRPSTRTYTQQGPLTDEFVGLIIQKLDNANNTLSKYLEQNIRRTSSSHTLMTSTTTTPLSIEKGDKMFM